MFRFSSPAHLLRGSALRSLKPARFQAIGIQRQYSTSNNIVHEVRDLKHFAKFTDDEKLSVVDFYATWCGPCKALEPIFNALAERVPEVQFARVDVDEAQDIAQEYGITAMPTCLFFKKGEKLDTIIGANPPKLVKLIEIHGDVKISGR